MLLVAHDVKPILSPYLFDRVVYIKQRAVRSQEPRQK